MTDLRKALITYDGSNFALWHKHLRMTLMAQDLWGYTGAEAPVDDLKEQQQEMAAMTIISSSLSRHYQEETLQFEKPKQLMEHLEKKHEKKSVNARYTLGQKLRGERMESGSSLQDHLSKMHRLKTELQNAGETTEDEMFVLLILKSLPPEYGEAVSALKYKENVTVDVLHNILLRAEQEIKEEDEQVSHGAYAMHRRNGHHRGPSQHEFRGRCYNCGRRGHRAKQCPKKKKRKRRHQGRRSGHKHGHRGYRESACSIVRTKKEVNSVTQDRGTQGLWILDSGASAHICAERYLFRNMRQCTPIYLMQPDGSEITCRERGTVKLITRPYGSESHLTLRDALYVPELKKNIISLRKVDKCGGMTIIQNGRCDVYINDELAITGTAREDIDDLYHVSHAVEAKSQRRQEQVCNIDIWHQRLGHIAPSTIRKMQKNGIVEGVPEFEEKLDNAVSPSCAEGKMTRSSHPVLGLNERVQINV